LPTQQLGRAVGRADTLGDLRLAVAA
jgi:hypothetical protein